MNAIDVIDKTEGRYYLSTQEPAVTWSFIFIQLIQQSLDLQLSNFCYDENTYV